MRCTLNAGVQLFSYGTKTGPIVCSIIYIPRLIICGWIRLLYSFDTVCVTQWLLQVSQ